MTRPEQRRAYAIPLTLATCLAMSLGSFFGGLSIANRNAKALVEQYRTDQAATAQTNRVFYCSVFSRQADVFADAESEVGQAAHEAWLDLYRFAGCVPAR